MANSERSIDDIRLTPSYLPVESRSAPLGSGASLRVHSTCRAEEMQALMKLAKRVLGSSTAVQRVGDRVYELMQEEFRYIQDHHPGSRSRL
ncbi:MAG: hypothetical protein VKL39_17605 [Leptolyngbyaceae bacterium]|nr:hypothetical protein [Leptolyngbyaceae bacterium]